VADGYGTHQIPWAEVRGLAQDDEHGYLVSLTGDRGLPLDRYLAHTARNEPLLWTVAQRAAAADRKRPIHPSHAESQEDAFLDRMPGLMEYMGMGAIMLALLPVLWIAVDVVAWLRGRLSVAAMLVTVGLLLLVVGIPFARPLVRAGRRGIHAGDPHHRLLGWLRLGIGLALTAGAVLLCVLILLRPFR
jgi:hypothetical protein